MPHTGYPLHSLGHGVLCLLEFVQPDWRCAIVILHLEPLLGLAYRMLEQALRVAATLQR